MTSTAPFTRLSSSLMPNETAICWPTIKLLLRDAATTLLVYCPTSGGWHTAEWWGAKWLDSATLSHELKPTHWTTVPGSPDDKQDESGTASSAPARTLW